MDSLSSRKKKILFEISNKPIEPTQLEKAVRDGHLTAYKACKLYLVNTGTVSAHLRGITKSERKGRPPKFNIQQEKVLLDLIFQLASWCFALSSK